MLHCLITFLVLCSVPLLHEDSLSTLSTLLSAHVNVLRSFLTRWFLLVSALRERSMYSFTQQAGCELLPAGCVPAMKVIFTSGIHLHRAPTFLGYRCLHFRCDDDLDVTMSVATLGHCTLTCGFGISTTLHCKWFFLLNPWVSKFECTVSSWHSNGCPA